MHALLLMTLLSAAPAQPAVAASHGIVVPAPEGWAASKDGTTVVFTSPSKDAQLRVDLYEKDAAGDPQDCVDQLVEKLSRAEKASKDGYTPSAIDGQPATTQVTFTPDRKHRQKRLVGCNGKSYFLIDWIEQTHSSTKYDKAFTRLLTTIKYGTVKPAATQAAAAPEK